MCVWPLRMQDKRSQSLGKALQAYALKKIHAKIRLLAKRNHLSSNPLIMQLKMLVKTTDLERQRADAKSEMLLALVCCLNCCLHLIFVICS